MKLEISSEYTYAIVGFVGWVAINFPRGLPPAVLPLIESEFGISHTQSALAMSSYLLPYAAMQVPAGFLCDRFGSRLLMLVSMFGSAVGGLLIGFTSSFGQFLAVRILAGTLSSLWYSSSTNMMIKHTQVKTQGRILGIVFMGGGVASVLIYLIVGVASSWSMGWRPFFLVSSIPGFIAAILTFKTARDVEEESVVVKVERKTQIVGQLMGRSWVLLLLVNNFLSGLAGWALTTFVPSYFVQNRGIPVAEESALMLTQAVFSVFSSMVAGYVADAFAFKVPVVISTVMMCLVSLLTPITPLGLPMILLMLLWGLIGGWAFTAFNLFIIRNIPVQVRGTFLGIYNLMQFVAATIGPPVFGAAIDSSGFNSFFILALAFYLACLASVLLIRKKS